MIFRKWKNEVITILVMISLCFVFTACETLDNIGDAISGIFNGNTESSDSKNSSTGGTKLAVKASSYRVPDNYNDAYSYRTDTVDKTIQTYIKNKSVDVLRNTNPDEYIKTVAAKINEIGENDFERVKLAHDVICLLVSYDAKNFWANTVPDQSWQNVVKTKTAVCEGYANLFQKFSSELKIKSQKVSGYARGVGSDISRENSFVANHAWNIICIADCWYLIDCTWDSGYMNGKSAVQAYSTDWLFLRPEHFIYTHLPSESKNQLIQPSLSNTEFAALPDFRPKLFELSGDAFASVKKINTADDHYEIEYKLKEGYVFTYRISSVGGTEIKNHIYTDKDSDKTITRMDFPNAGRYMVTVYYGKESARSSQSCGQFMVEASAGNDVQYPTIYPIASKGTRLVMPKQSPLKTGENVSFEVFCEDRPFVAVIIGRNFIQLENDGTGNFSGQVEIPGNTKQISIGVSKSERGSYETLAVFTVR